MSPFLLEDNPFKTVKWLVDSVWDQELGGRASPSEVYPGGKFKQHFACGFHFKIAISGRFISLKKG